MMKFCCLIVIIFCTIDVSNGGNLSGKCLASKGTCGKKGVPCNETFGSDWTYNGKCCNNRPCCKFLKAPCVPETCPKGFKVLSAQTSSANCYYTSGPNQVSWNTAADNCASTDGAYLWRPNTEHEAKAVQNEFNIPIKYPIWTGANDIDNDGTFTFAIENGLFSFNDLPFGFGKFYDNLAKVYTPYVDETANKQHKRRSVMLWTVHGIQQYICVLKETFHDNGVCVNIENLGQSLWLWTKKPCTFVTSYICEYKLRVCP